MTPKEEFLKESKDATPVNTQMINKSNSLFTAMQNVLGVLERRSKQLQHLLKPKPNPEQGPNSSVLWRLRGARKLGRKSEASRGRFMTLKDRSLLHNRKVQGEAARADVEAAASYPEDPAQIINEGGYRKEVIFNVE